MSFSIYIHPINCFIAHWIIFCEILISYLILSSSSSFAESKHIFPNFIKMFDKNGISLVKNLQPIPVITDRLFKNLKTEGESYYLKTFRKDSSHEAIYIWVHLDSFKRFILDFANTFFFPKCFVRPSDLSFNSTIDSNFGINIQVRHLLNIQALQNRGFKSVKEFFLRFLIKSKEFFCFFKFLNWRFIEELKNTEEFFPAKLIE